MIIRIDGQFGEGDILELKNYPEPLYIFHNGKLFEITPEEYNICVVKEPKERFFEIWKKRALD
ncbi:MAG: hypothetical protein WA061_02030 [Microgenomates group bacterium]